MPEFGYPELGPHGDSHLNGGSDEFTLEGLSGLLADAQTPLGHGSSHEENGADELDLGALGSGAATTGQLPEADGSGGVAWATRAGPFYNAYVCVRDKKSQGTNGGTFTQGAWRTRDINDEQADDEGICSISSNQITLAAGTYECYVSCPSFAVGNSQARLYDITNSGVLVLGTTGRNSVTYSDQRTSIIIGQFTLAAQTVLEIQHYCQATYAGTGFGTALNITDEIYTVAEFRRRA